MAIWLHKDDSFNNTILRIKEKIGKLDSVDKQVSFNPSYIVIEGPYIDYLTITYSRSGLDHKWLYHTKLFPGIPLDEKINADTEATMGMAKNLSQEGYSTCSRMLG